MSRRSKFNPLDPPLLPGILPFGHETVGLIWQAYLAATDNLAVDSTAAARVTTSILLYFQDQAQVHTDLLHLPPYIDEWGGVKLPVNVVGPRCWIRMAFLTSHWGQPIMAVVAAPSTDYQWDPDNSLGLYILDDEQCVLFRPGGHPIDPLPQFSYRDGAQQLITYLTTIGAIPKAS